MSVFADHLAHNDANWLIWASRERCGMSGRLLTACLLALVLLVRFAYASDHGGRDSGANVIVRQIMAADLARCSSSVNGVRLFSYAPSSGTEVAQIQSLGKDATLTGAFDTSRHSGCSSSKMPWFASGHCTVRGPWR